MITFTEAQYEAMLHKLTLAYYAQIYGNRDIKTARQGIEELYRNEAETMLNATLSVLEYEVAL